MIYFFDILGVPFLPWESEVFSTQLSALLVEKSFFIYLKFHFFDRGIMSAPVIKFKTVEKVDKIYQILSAESHHGFPVVDHHSNEVRISLFFLIKFLENFI